jgi:uncharacterized protein with HEPN domain
LSREDRLLLQDIAECADRIIAWTAERSLSDLESADMLYAAVLHELAVIGEAVKQLSAETRGSEAT